MYATGSTYEGIRFRRALLDTVNEIGPEVPVSYERASHFLQTSLLI